MFILLSCFNACWTSQPSTLHLFSERVRATRNSAFVLPGAVCKFIIYSFSCFADLLVSPRLHSLPLSEVTFKSCSLFSLETACSFLIAPVASLLLLVVVIIRFSHFPICCNNFLLSHSEEACRQTPCLMCEQKMKRKNDAPQPFTESGSVHITVCLEKLDRKKLKSESGVIKAEEGEIQTGGIQNKPVNSNQAVQCLPAPLLLPVARTMKSEPASLGQRKG